MSTASETDEFAALVDAIGSDTGFVNLDERETETAVRPVGTAVFAGFPNSRWARSWRPWGASAFTAPLRSVAERQPDAIAHTLAA